MNNAAQETTTVNIYDHPQYNENAVAKIPTVKGNDITSEVYYFKPGQILAYHRHPSGDQIFYILKGTGTFYLDDGTERALPVRDGAAIIAPAGVWHQLVNDNQAEMVAIQVTKANAGMEARQYPTV